MYADTLKCLMSHGRFPSALLDCHISSWALVGPTLNCVCLLSINQAPTWLCLCSSCHCQQLPDAFCVCVFSWVTLQMRMSSHVAVLSFCQAHWSKDFTGRWPGSDQCFQWELPEGVCAGASEPPKKSRCSPHYLNCFQEKNINTPRNQAGTNLELSSEKETMSYCWSLPWDPHVRTLGSKATSHLITNKNRCLAVPTVSDVILLIKSLPDHFSKSESRNEEKRSLSTVKNDTLDGSRCDICVLQHQKPRTPKQMAHTDTKPRNHKVTKCKHHHGLSCVHH